MSLKFDWDPRKAARNKQKHSVSFEEAATVFADPLSATVHDPDHSLEEERFITIGKSKNHKLLLVAYTERNNNIRIISARELTGREKREYGEETGIG